MWQSCVGNYAKKRLEKLKRKEQEKLGLKDEEEKELEKELTSRLESFEVKQTKKN